ncbi:MAG: T9SS type A sorting domain-containing protein [Ignavibacteriaceae bacterium]|nr:T9SS type A sorting domain-containing protein [Ignavibacteriaceae bacterium]
MFKQINIILCFLLFFSFDWALSQDNFNVFVPEFIPSDGSFEVSIITSKKFPEADRLDFYFLPDFSLIINKAELWIDNVPLQIPMRSEFVIEYSKQYQKVSIDFSDTALFSDGAFFQLVIFLKSMNTNSNALNFFGEFISAGKILEYLTSSDSKIISNIPNLYSLSFNFYEKYLTAENAASFSRDSYLNVPLVYNFDKALAVDFWMKAKNFRSTFLKFINWETNHIEYYLSLSENQMLVINSKGNDLFQVKPFFISQNVWYHFNVFLDKLNSELSFFCNDEELARIKIRNYLELDNLVLHFENDLQIGNFILDQLRLVNVSGSFTSLSRNRNFPDYSDDSSSVIFQVNFSETELNDLLNKKIISYERIRVAKSDAPLFPRAPEISVKLMNNFYEIEWKGGSYREAYHYILEKAIGNGEFSEAGTQAAVNDEEKTYSILSEEFAQPEIVYFRIKQVNKDGSEVYSDVVKVGQGIVEDVIVGQNYPNPFNPITLIDFELLLDSDVEIKVYDLTGKEVALLHSGFLAKGVYQFKFDASGLTSGIYLYQIITPLSSQTKKMILAK